MTRCKMPDITGYPGMSALKGESGLEADASREDASDGAVRGSRLCRCAAETHVAALLDTSEESALRELDPFECPTEAPSWEEAVQGWARCAPLAGAFQTPGRGRPQRVGQGLGVGYHCLLCVEFGLSEEQPWPPHGESPKSCGGATEETGREEPQTCGEMLWKVHSNISTSSFSSSEGGRSGFSTHDGGNGAPSLRRVGGDRRGVDGGGVLQGRVAPDDPSPALTSRVPGGVALIINSFTVLPPVKPSSRQHQIGHALPDAALADREATGTVPGYTAEPVLEEEGLRPKVTPDAPQGSVSSPLWLSNHGPNLLSTFPAPKRPDLTLSSTTDTLPPTACPLGRPPRQDEGAPPRPPHRAGHRLYFCLRGRSLRHVEAELPVLCGTGVAVPLPAQRLL